MHLTINVSRYSNQKICSILRSLKSLVSNKFIKLWNRRCQKIRNHLIYLIKNKKRSLLFKRLLFLRTLWIPKKSKKERKCLWKSKINKNFSLWSIVNLNRLDSLLWMSWSRNWMNDKNRFRMKSHLNWFTKSLTQATTSFKRSPRRKETKRRQSIKWPYKSWNMKRNKSVLK